MLDVKPVNWSAPDGLSGIAESAAAPQKVTGPSGVPPGTVAVQVAKFVSAEPFPRLLHCGSYCEGHPVAGRGAGFGLVAAVLTQMYVRRATAGRRSPGSPDAG